MHGRAGVDAFRCAERESSGGYSAATRLPKRGLTLTVGHAYTLTDYSVWIESIVQAMVNLRLLARAGSQIYPLTPIHAVTRMIQIEEDNTWASPRKDVCKTYRNNETK